MHFLTCFMFWVFFWGDMGFLGRVNSPSQEIAGINTDVDTHSVVSAYHLV